LQNGNDDGEISLQKESSLTSSAGFPSPRDVAVFGEIVHGALTDTSGASKNFQLFSQNPTASHGQVSLRPSGSSIQPSLFELRLAGHPRHALRSFTPSLLHGARYDQRPLIALRVSEANKKQAYDEQANHQHRDERSS
jgi:hypothetical protein